MREEIFQELRNSLLIYDGEEVARLAKEVVDKQLNVLTALDVLVTGIDEIGSKFEKNEIFLPELMLAGEAMKAGMAILTPAVPAGEATQTLGTIVIGTVRGDLHDIGKNIVKTMLQTSGFNVIDLGIDVSPGQFAEEARKNKADIVGASAVLSTTTPGLKDVIEYFEALKIREKFKIMVGGGACTREYAERIGADGYGEDAAEAVKIAKQIIIGV
jgi:methylmalonyl-CoA mutase cobalamin-binding domain/chain